jgi:ubiquinone/menaquinone biosynthesis C-methylase UbiE
MKKTLSKDYFEKVADSWESMQHSFFSEAARKKAYEIAKVNNQDTIADIGCGTGYISEGLIDMQIKIIAVDQSQAMINEMKKKFINFNNIYYRLGESENLPIDDNEVNYAFANMYLHHVNDPSKSIIEMFRIIKPGGKLIITDLDEHNFDFLRKEQYDRWLGFKRSDLKIWFENAGFKNVRVDCVGDNCCAKSSQKDEQASISIFIAYGEK